jgi:hypothetical protein
MIFRSNPVRFPVPPEQRIQVSNLDEINFDDPVILENLVSAMTAMLARPGPNKGSSVKAQSEQENSPC